MSESRFGQVEELERFALETLPSMRNADGGFCWDVEAPALERRGSSLRYALICLLGLQRAEQAGLDVSIDAEELRGYAVDRIDEPEMTVGDLGLLAWADARAGGRAMDAIGYRLHGRIGNGIPDLEGLELSWLVIGATESHSLALLEPALRRQLQRAETRSGLFAHRDEGRRARFPNFATQIYGVLALSLVARYDDDRRALRAARKAADRLLELQQPDGGWPWIYDVQTGRVVEPYEIYSVHQDAMAPMALLELAEVSGDARYRDAALHGLDWIFGANELGRQMLDRDAGILYRSIRRRAPFDRAALYLSSATAAAVGRAALARARGPVELNPTDRPYHLGWVLEAWAGREEQANG